MSFKSSRNAMGRRGIVAMLDGLLAYSIAFVAIGIIAVLISNPPEARMKSSYALNIWAEDLADAIGMSLVDNATGPAGPSKYWLANNYDDAAVIAINKSLTGIADEKNLSFHVDIDGTTNLSDIGNLSQASQVATAKRFLIEVNSTFNPTGDVSVLTVKVGRK
jgi:hypothetical protein